MAMSKRARIVPGEEDRERLKRTRTNPHSILRHVRRPEVALRLDEGLTLSQTMRATGMSKPTVWRWWDRFLAEVVDGLLRHIPVRTGRKPDSEERAGEANERAMPPPVHRSHWTLRALAKRQGSPSRQCPAS